MSTPRPPVSSLTASLNPSASTTSDAPAALAAAILSSVLTTAMVRAAPQAGANRSVDVPTPPAAPCTKTVSPLASRPRVRSAWCTVRSLNSRPAPASNDTVSGSLNTRSGCNTTTSAIAPHSIVSAATRSPAVTCAPSGALRTTPATSAPRGVGQLGLVLGRAPAIAGRRETPHPRRARR